MDSFKRCWHFDQFKDGLQAALGENPSELSEMIMCQVTVFAQDLRVGW